MPMTYIARLATRVPSLLPAQAKAPWSCTDTSCYSNIVKLNSVKKLKPIDHGPFASFLDYQSRLQFNTPPLPVPLSGIICTVGPASNNPETLIQLIEAGMRVIRLNFSHGSYEYHSKIIQSARQAIDCYEKRIGVYKPVAIALDTKGPEIRTGQIAGNQTADLRTGDNIKLSTNKSLESKGDKNTVYVDYESFPKLVKLGSTIFIDDGLIALQVQEVSGSDVICQVVNGGKLGSRKGVNLPGIAVDLPSVSEKDKQDLLFGVKNDVDIVFASFIRNAKAIEEIRQILGPTGKHIKIIAKIENQQGLEHIDEIIAASDGVMVARGDMGIEIRAEEVILAQKSLIAKCNKVGKPVICATQMLESMVEKPRPTRAEASDVGNAVFDGADCVMLSGETAKGKYPVECVKCMTSICAKVENVLWYDRIQNDLKIFMKSTSSDNISAITSGITEIASVGQADAIVVVSHCPIVAQLISQLRPRCPIVFLTSRRRIARQSVIYRGIYPIVPEIMSNGCNDFATILATSIEYMAKMKIVNADMPMTLMIVNALQADRITFRLLHTKKKSQQTKCKEAAQAQAQAERAQAKKTQIRDSQEKVKEVQTPQTIEKCKERCAKGTKKLDPEADDTEKMLQKCINDLKKSNKNENEDDTCN